MAAGRGQWCNCNAHKDFQCNYLASCFYKIISKLNRFLMELHLINYIDIWTVSWLSHTYEATALHLSAIKYQFTPILVQICPHSFYVYFVFGRLNWLDGIKCNDWDIHLQAVTYILFLHTYLVRQFAICYCKDRKSCNVWGSASATCGHAIIADSSQKAEFIMANERFLFVVVRCVLLTRCSLQWTSVYLFVQRLHFV